MPSRRSNRLLAAAGIGVAAVLVAVGLYVVFGQVSKSLLPGSSSVCEARANGQSTPLTPGQAGIAATIAAVARREAMPLRAVTVAYAAALQESDLANLDYGDRDSVGVFQQRPSQGWGSARQLEDPVYATTKFFAALIRVRGYLHLQVYRAAQAVQRSADGYAYQQYALMAAGLASAFTGRSARAVWCGFARRPGKAQLTAAARQLNRDFGPLSVQAAADPVITVKVRRAMVGWAVASWLVSHAAGYGIREIRCLGFQWTFARGGRGWTRERASSRARASAIVLLTG